MSKFLRLISGASAVEYGLLLAFITVVMLMANHFFRPTGFNLSDYKEVAIKDLFEDPKKFGEGAKISVVGYSSLVSKDHRGPVKHPGTNGYLYNLQERQEVSYYGNPEIPVIASEESLPYRTEIWGVLRKKNIAGREYYLEAVKWRLWKQKE